MLNPFPDFLTYKMLAPLIIRLVLSVYILTREYAVLKTPASIVRRIVSILFMLAAVLVFVGMFTQIAVIAIMLLTVFRLIYKSTTQTLGRKSLMLHIFVFAISLSLLFSGAGAFAIDLPL